MSSSNRALRELTALVENLGVSLSAKVAEIFDAEVRPSIERALMTQGARIFGDITDGMILWPRNSNSLLRVMHPHSDQVRLGKERARRTTQQRLCEFDLIATGSRCAGVEAEPSELILPNRWQTTEIHERAEAVCLGGVSYRDVRVARADHLSTMQRTLVRQLVIASAQASEQRDLQVEEKPRPGRESLCDEIQDEMERRALRGTILPTLAAEVRALLKIRAKDTDVMAGRAVLPTVGTAKNHLRKKYKELATRRQAS